MFDVPSFTLGLFFGADVVMLIVIGFLARWIREGYIELQDAERKDAEKRRGMR